MPTHSTSADTRSRPSQEKPPRRSDMPDPPQDNPRRPGHPPDHHGLEGDEGGGGEFNPPPRRKS